MSKLKQHLTEKTHPFLNAWEESYLNLRQLKDMLGLMLEGDDVEKVEELMKIVVELEKTYVKNTRKVMSITNKLEQ